MISETSDLPEDIREQGHQTILSLINNYAESDEVRMAAITALPYTRPDSAVFNKLALRTCWDPSNQVVSYIHTMLRSKAGAQMFKYHGDSSMVDNAAMLKVGLREEFDLSPRIILYKTTVEKVPHTASTSQRLPSTPPTPSSPSPSTSSSGCSTTNSCRTCGGSCTSSRL